MFIPAGVRVIYFYPDDLSLSASSCAILAPSARRRYIDFLVLDNFALLIIVRRIFRIITNLVSRLALNF